MSKNRATTWHLWAGIALALPIFVVSVTAVFIAHDRRLGLKEMPVAAQWLPGYRLMAAASEPPEVKAIHTDGHGQRHLGTKAGLFVVTAEAIREVGELRGIEVRSIDAGDGLLAAATRRGVFVNEGGAWRKVLAGDAHAVGWSNGVLVAALKERGLMTSGDRGQTWQADGATMERLGSVTGGYGSEALTLSKLVMDLHTGKAFFGKDAEWVWIDVVGAAMALLAVTGVLMWVRVQRRRVRAGQESSAVGGAPSTGA